MQDQMIKAILIAHIYYTTWPYQGKSSQQGFSYGPPLSYAQRELQ